MRRRGFRRKGRRCCGSAGGVPDQVQGKNDRQTMNAIIWLFDTVITLYIWVLIGNAIYSWLVAFNVINPRNQVVNTIGEFLYRATEPVLAPIRRRLPNLGGIDISPVVLIIGLIFVRMFVLEILGGLRRIF
jgi:YggT family protein